MCHIWLCAVGCDNQMNGELDAEVIREINNRTDTSSYFKNADWNAQINEKLHIRYVAPVILHAVIVKGDIMSGMNVKRIELLYLEAGAEEKGWKTYGVSYSNTVLNKCVNDKIPL